MRSPVGSDIMSTVRSSHKIGFCYCFYMVQWVSKMITASIVFWGASVATVLVSAGYFLHSNCLIVCGEVDLIRGFSLESERSWVAIKSYLHNFVGRFFLSTIRYMLLTLLFALDSSHPRGNWGVVENSRTVVLYFAD